jgi:hypothetical protein
LLLNNKYRISLKIHTPLALFASMIIMIRAL